MTIREVTEILEAWAPLPNAEDFDNVGLLVGNTEQEVTQVLVAHDALEHVVTEAIQKKCNLIVCFHPIIFSGMKRITGKNYVERAVIKAIKNDIAIYAIHTALDNVPHGVNHGMSRALGLTDCSILIPKSETIYKLTTYVPHAFAKMVIDTLFKVGAGTLGNYDECSFTNTGNSTYNGKEGAQPTLGEIGIQHREPETQIHITFEKRLESKVLAALLKSHPYEEVAYEITALKNTNQHLGMGMIGKLPQALEESEFLSLIKKTFKTGGVRHSALLGKKIESVAVLGGSGAFGIKNAIHSNADAYVTADLKYHDYYTAENKILIADVGHYESERFTKNIIADYLTEKIRNFAIILSKENTNPINYF
jgi:dinuclear metal center YbgI/SA1388 family protein